MQKAMGWLYHSHTPKATSTINDPKTRDTKNHTVSNSFILYFHARR